MARKYWRNHVICGKSITDGDDVAFFLGGRNIVLGNISHIYAGDHGTAPQFAAYAFAFKGGGMVEVDDIEDVIVNPDLPDDRPRFLDGGPNRWKRLKEYQEEKSDGK
jgi:hypothetical protein